MYSFNRYLTEAQSLETTKLKHLEHPEDLVISNGDEGLKHSIDILNGMKSFLMGRKSNAAMSVKYDGAPSIVFGINPENGKFFVASKSVFNKKPKINYTEKDIETNHPNAPGLMAKLKLALEHLPKIMPKHGGVYQGDFMYGPGDLKTKEGVSSFTPNTITYSAPDTSPTGQKVKNSKIGFVAHVSYEGPTMADLRVKFNTDQSQFKKHPDVYLIDPTMKNGRPNGFTTNARTLFNDKIKKAQGLYKNISKETIKRFDDHNIFVRTFINKNVRDDTIPTAEKYAEFLTDMRYAKTAAVNKLPSKEKRAMVFDKLLDDLDAKLPEWENVFELVNTLGSAKNILVKAIGNPTDFEHTIVKNPTNPEGFVSVINGKPAKIVDRQEFSKANFSNPKNWDTTDVFKDIEDITDDVFDGTNPVVFTFGRMNPPTAGHNVLIAKVKALAQKYGAESEVVVSHSSDPEKNPLLPDEKLDFLKKFFPDTNIAVATEDEPNFLKQAQRLYRKGHKSLVMVAGADRVAEYDKTLNSYNGSGPGKLFNFKKIKVVSAGMRDPDKEGVEGMSASKMRQAAGEGDIKKFQAGVPPHVSREDVMKLYNTLRQRMYIKINAQTSGISLARYAKRKDEVGARARAEINRRNQAVGFQLKQHVAGSDTSNRSLARYAKRKDPVGQAAKAQLGRRKKLKESVQAIGKISRESWIQKKVYTNPTPTQFKKLASSGYVRWLRTKDGNWIMWTGDSMIHGEVVKALGLGKSYDMDWIANVGHRRDKGLIGAQLMINDKDIFLEHDILNDSDLDWLTDVLVKDKKFKAIIKGFEFDTRKSEPDEGRNHLPSSERINVGLQSPVSKVTGKLGQIRKKNKKIEDRTTTPWATKKKKVVKKKYDAYGNPLNEAKSGNSSLSMFDKGAKTFGERPRIIINPSNSRFMGLTKETYSIRLIKLGSDWYVWDGRAYIHSEVMERVFFLKSKKAHSKYGDDVMTYHGPDRYREEKNILGFELRVRNGNELVYHKDAWGHPDEKETFNRLKRDKSFREFTRGFIVKFMGLSYGGITAEIDGTKDTRKRVVVKKRYDAYGNPLNEETSHEDLRPVLDKFVEFCANKLGLSEVPEIIHKNTTDGEQPSFAAYAPHANKVYVATKNRHPMDIFRSIAHELVHHKQNEEGRITDAAKEGATGSDIENEANSMAGQLMRWFGKANPDCFGMSYVTEETLTEGLHDPSIFKAVILGGAPGSGKDKILKDAIEGNGLRELNSDKAFEYLLKKAGHSMVMSQDSAERDKIRGRAKVMTKEAERHILDGRLGVIINGTADDYAKVHRIKQLLEQLGYETMMVFVNTSDEVSKNRNIARGQRGGREVPEVIRFAKWTGAQQNMKQYQHLFGGAFVEFDNSMDLHTATPELKKLYNDRITQVFRKVRAFVSRPVNNNAAQVWIAQHKAKRGISEMDEKFQNFICEVGGAGNWGTPELTRRYQLDTPGQEGLIQGFQVGKTVNKEMEEIHNKSIRNWMSKSSTIERFRKKYGALGERKLYETALKLSRESLEGAIYDGQAVQDSSTKDAPLAPENTPSLNKERKPFTSRIRNKKK